MDIFNLEFLRPIVNEFTLALRNIARYRPSTWAVLATFTIACAINGVVFSFLVATERGSFHFQDPDRLISVWQLSTDQQTGGASRGRDLVTDELLLEWRARARSLASIAAYRPWQLPVRDEIGSTRIPVKLVSANFFSTIGVRPRLGGVPDDPSRFRSAAVVSHQYWASSLKRKPDVIGTSIEVDGRMFEIVAVLPESFRDALTTNSKVPLLYLPLSVISDPPLQVRAFHVVGRKAGEIPLDRIQQELQTIADEMRSSRLKNTAPRIIASTFRAEAGGELRLRLQVLTTATLGTLLLAAGTFLMFLMSRVSSQIPSMAVRSALGGTSFEVVRPLLFEVFLIVFVGCAVSLWLAGVVSQAAEYLLPGNIFLLDEDNDIRRIIVIGFTDLAVFASFAIVLLSAVGRLRFVEFLRAGVSWRSRGVVRWHQAVSILQIIVTITMLSGFCLLMRHWGSLERLELGFNDKDL